MWWKLGGGGGSGAAAAAAAAVSVGVGVGVRMIGRRHMSGKSGVGRNLRKIDPKVPYEEASLIAENLYNLIKQHGPLTVSNTWNHSLEAGVGGLNSKTHMKLMLKWMRGRNMLKLFCNQVGSSKKFLHCTLPEDPQSDQSKKLMELKLHANKFSPKRKKQQQIR